MLTKNNYRHVCETAKMIRACGGDRIMFVFLAPYGYADLFFNSIVPTYLEVRPYVNKAMRWLKKNSEICIILENFPYCCVSSDFRDYVLENRIKDKDIMFGALPEKSIMRPVRISKIITSVKQKISQCKKCKFCDRCEGVYRRYVKRRGCCEFSPIE